MLPYPSGTLHMGHMLVYTLGDVRAHFYRRNGYEVMRPMGFDSFGLPSENAAIAEGGHPREITERNIRNIRETMKRVGWAIDWDREVSTHEDEYIHWNQWLFLRLYEAGLIYRKPALVKWCPKDQTVLANEQVQDGRCKRCGSVVEARTLEQWFFRTTAYADELLNFERAGLARARDGRAARLDRRSRGRGRALPDRGARRRTIAVFTTRPDTLFGSTFFVLAPEHPLVEQLADRSPHADEIRDYVRVAAAKRGEERAASDAKTGVFTGFHAINPVNDERLPIWVADYVLMDYGTGAIMAVPAHDERDFQFAQTFDLPGRARGRAGGRRGCPRARRSWGTRRTRCWWTRRSSRAGEPGGEARDRRVARRAGARQAGDQLPAARLGLLAPALLGLPDPDRLLRRARHRARPG